MQKVYLKRGLDIPIDGRAQEVISSIDGGGVYSIDPNDFVGIKPKMLVKEGDMVKIGSPLFRDKTFEEMVVVSPVSGKVVEINRGERRKVLAIRIESDGEGEFVDFKKKIDSANSSSDVRTLLLESGYWTLITQRPYACVALPNKTPEAIFISTFDSSPLAPDYEFLLRGKISAIQQAVSLLGKIAPIYIGLRGGIHSVFGNLKQCSLYEVYGSHPAGNIGVQINNIRPISKGATVWTMSIHDLALLGEFLVTGKVVLDRLIALVGPLVYTPQYYRAVPGVCLNEIVSCNIHKECPYMIINGSPISGREIPAESSVTYMMNQVTVIDAGSDTHEFMGWLLPRFSSFNTHCTDPAKFMDCGCIRSLLNMGAYKWDARLKGGLRPIIVSNEYDKVFPMDIYPEYLIKAMIAGNIDKMEQLGACEVAPEDFALCEYVCTSKLPLQAIVRRALDNMRKEIE